MSAAAGAGPAAPPSGRARRIATAYAAGSLLLLAGILVMLGLTVAAGVHRFPPEWQFQLLLGCVASSLGWLLLRRRPAQHIGWTMAALGMVGLFGSAVLGYGSFSLNVHPLPAAGWVYYVGTCIPSTALVPLLALTFLIFPDGRLPSPRWRWAAAAVVLAFLLDIPGQLTTAPAGADLPALPNPLHVDSPLLEALTDVASALQLVALLGGAASVAARWRRADATARQQIKFLLAAAILWFPAVLFLLLTPSRVSNGVAGQFVFVTPVMIMVVAVGLAVLRYRLYDIDRVISRTLSYAVLTGLLVGAYVGVVAFATKLLPLSSSVGVAASTLTVAAAFNPVRRRVQAVVDRRFNRSRYDGAELAAVYGARLRDEATIDEITTTLLSAVSASVQPAEVSLWLAS